MKFIGLLLLTSVAFAQPAPPAHPYPRVDDTLGYKGVPDWPRDKPPAGGEWTAAMSSVAIGPDGNVWTLNRGKMPVQVYSPDGRLVKAWGHTAPAGTDNDPAVFRNPHTVRFDAAGNLWLVDTGHQTVRRFSQDGKVLQTIGTPDMPGEDATHMNQPNDVAVAANGDLYVSDGYGNNRIVVFDRHGKFLRAWGKLGQGQGEFSQPHSIVLDSKGRVYVADRNNSRIQIFDAKGKFLGEWRNIVTPWALEITKNDEIWVVGSSPMLWSEVPASQAYLATPPKDEVFMKLDAEGRLKQLWSVPKGDKPGELNWAHSIAVAPDGSIYFGEVMGRRAQKFVPAGSQAK